VRSALEKVPGVISAEVTHPDKAVVKVEKGKADSKKLIAAVEKAGYKASLKDEKK
jgi:copper chaperone CopZ